jgi:hypothetical protein
MNGSVVRSSHAPDGATGIGGAIGAIGTTGAVEGTPRRWELRQNAANRSPEVPQAMQERRRLQHTSIRTYWNSITGMHGRCEINDGTSRTESRWREILHIHADVPSSENSFESLFGLSRSRDRTPASEFVWARQVALKNRRVLHIGSGAAGQRSLPGRSAGCGRRFIHQARG